MASPCTRFTSDESSRLRCALRGLLWLLALSALGPAAQAQHIAAGGGAYLDYAVSLAPDSAAYDRGFAVRRAWATATAVRARTTMRLRLETDEATVPAVRLYEAFVRLDSVAGAHRLTLGLFQPESARQQEALWAHRFLARTLVGEDVALPSRDLGVQVQGPAGPLLYAVSATSGRGVRARRGDEGRLTASLAAVGEDGLQGLVALEYVRLDGATSTVASAHAAYGPAHARVGASAFVERGGPTEQQGAGLFAVGRVSERWRLVGRLDVSQAAGRDARSLHGVVGAVYRHDAALDLAPNVVFGYHYDEPAAAAARLTASLRF